jgi:hypothetical protein
MMQLRRLRQIARRRLKRYAGTRPGLYFPLMRWWGQSAHLLVTPQSDICIEGCPRSANSFAVSAFQSAQPEEVAVAHHTHAAANLLRACALRVPAVLLIRAPRSTVISRRALTLENHARTDREPSHAPHLLVEHLRDWLAFYRATRACMGRCVVAPFPQVVEDLGRVIWQVNRRFGRSFEVFEHTDANVQRIREGGGYHALPNEQRRAIKEEVRSDFEQLVARRPRVRRMLREAERLYDWYEKHG